MAARTWKLIAIGLLCANSAQAQQGHNLAGRVVSVSGTVLIRADQKDTRSSRPLKPGDKVYVGDVINTPSNGAAKLLLADRTILDIGASALFHVNQFSANHGGDRNVDLGMMYGTMRANVTQKIGARGKFRIRTPSATMGVRGTEFVLKTSLAKVSDLKRAALASNGKAKPIARQPMAPQRGAGPRSAAPVPKTELVVLQGRVDVHQEVAAKAPRVSGSRAPMSSQMVEKVIAVTAGQKLVADPAARAPAKPVVLPPEQIRAIVAEAKVEDNTFKSAVAFDPGKAQDSAATQKMISEAMSAAAQGQGPIGSAGAGGFIGTFGAGQALAPPPVNMMAGGLKKVHVVIQR